MLNKVQQTDFFFTKNSSYFQSNGKTQRGNGNQHDKNNDVDLKIGADYIRNGSDNFFPFEIESVTKRSMLQKRAFKTITSIVNGKMVWQNPDGSAVSANRSQQLNELYSSIGVKGKKFNKQIIDSNYLQGGCPVTLQFISDGFGFTLGNLSPRKYKTMRLSTPVWMDGKSTSIRHYYHKDWGYHYEGRNKKVATSSKTVSWETWNSDVKRYRDQACYINAYNPMLDLSDSVNRLQSYFIGDFDGLSDYYPIPCWFSGTTYNYEKAEFFLSCFDIDDIENGLHASGILKVYHSSYIDPESDLAIETFEEHKKQIEQKFKGGFNSGAISIVPTAISASGEVIPGEGYMEFEPIKTNSNKDRHEVFDKRIINKVLGANGVIMPELLGIRDEKSTLSESGAKLLNAVKLFNQFTIKPQKELLEDFYNDIVNPILGIEEKIVIAPDLSAFLSLSDEVMKHFLHPEQVYDMYIEFGLSKPTMEQIQSELIPAYVRNNQTS